MANLTTNEMIQKIFYGQKILNISFSSNTESNGPMYEIILKQLPKSRVAKKFLVCVNQETQKYSRIVPIGSESLKKWN